jgi:hypothetical protein
MGGEVGSTLGSTLDATVGASVGLAVGKGVSAGGIASAVAQPDSNKVPIINRMVEILVIIWTSVITKEIGLFELRLFLGNAAIRNLIRSKDARACMPLWSRGC